jgi:hypothetical protein
MPRGSGYAIRLTLTREMRIALTKLTAQEEEPKDFPMALRCLRLGLYLHGVLSDNDYRTMYQRQLVSDDELQWLREAGYLTEDVRPIRSEPLLEAQQRKDLNQLLGQVLRQWPLLQASAQQHWWREAKRHPDLPNAERLLQCITQRPCGVEA